MEAIRSFCDKHGMQIIGTVPYDEAMMDAERLGTAPLDHAADSAGVRAIRDIAAKIDAMAGPQRHGNGVTRDADR